MKESGVVIEITFAKVASLRVLLWKLEREVGIEQIGSIKKRVLLSIADLTSFLILPRQN